jgi:hypothetical protein
VVGMVVVGAIGAAAAIAILAPRFLSSSFPTISQFQLVDPDVGPGGIARHRELQVQLQVDEESGDGLGDITWLLRESTVPQPTPQDLDWASSPPSTYVLSPGDGPKPVDLWLKGRKDEITHGAQFLVLLDTTFPQDPSRAFSSSHQIATPSTNNLVTVQWEAAQDPEPGSGIAGYSTVWDRFPTTLPDPVLDLDGSVTETISPPLEFGTWYFHLSTLDRAGNFTTTLHVGPFVIIDSSFARAPSSGTDGQTDSTAGGTSGGEAGPPSSVEETAPGVDQPEPLQPLEELPADVPPAEGPVGPVPEIPSDNRPGEQVDDSGDISGGGGEQGSEADSEPDNNEDRGGDTGGDGGGPGDLDGSNSGAGSGDDGSSGGGGVQSDDDDDDGDGNFLPFQPDPTGPPPGEQVRLSVTVVVTGDTISRVEDIVIYTYVVTNDSSSDATPLILDDLTDTLLGNLNSPAIEAGCGTLLPGGSCSFELSHQVQPADPDPLVNAVTANYHSQGFGETLSDADSHSVDLFQPLVVMSVTGGATSRVGDSVTYAYIVTNTSSDDAPDLVLASITDDLLEDLTGNAADAGCSVLASGDLCSFEVTRQVLSEDPDPLVNTVEARYQPQGFSGNITNSGSHSVDVLGPAEDGIPSGVDCNPNIADHHVVDPLGAVPASFLGMAHKTLQSAVTAASDNQVISLYADIRENVVIGSSTTSGDKDLLIVGCGHTITADASTFPVVHVEVSAGADDGDTGVGSSDINIEGLDVQGGSTGFLVETSKSPVGTGTSLRAVRADSNGVGIKIIGSNNVVRGANSINSNTGFGVQIIGDNNVIETSKLEENGDSAIHVTGDGNQIKGNDVGDTNRGNGREGISVNGDSNVIEENNVFASAGTGINLVGDKGSIKENNVGTNNGLRSNGDGVVVKGYYTLTDRNDILANRGLGISATDANSSMPEGNDGGTNNRWNEGAGVQVTGNGVAIEENEVFSNGGAGIEVTGDSAAIKENRVGANHQGNTGNGIQVTGNGATIEENEVFNSGGAGIVVDGDENVVKENRVGNENDQGNGGDGISVTGGNNMIEGNQVFGNAEDGIDVSGGSAKLPNIVKQNKVGDSGGKGNGGHGILVSGDGNGDGNPVEIKENTVKASGLAGIKVEGTGRALRENESGGKGAEDNGGCDYDLAEGNLDQRGNHSDGSAVDLSVSGCTDEAPGDDNGSVD